MGLGAPAARSPCSRGRRTSMSSDPARHGCRTGPVTPAPGITTGRIVPPQRHFPSSAGASAGGAWEPHTSRPPTASGAAPPLGTPGTGRPSTDDGEPRTRPGAAQRGATPPEPRKEPAACALQRPCFSRQSPGRSWRPAGGGGESDL